VETSDQIKESNNDTAHNCNKRKIPLWLVLIDNIPTLILFALGIVIIYQLSVIGAIFFGIYTLFSIVWFWAKICPYCYHYNTLACPCGYGIISSRLFRKEDEKSFKKAFRNNIWIVFPNWFIPLAIAIYLLIIRYSAGILILMITFCLVGFVIIPAVSKLVGCKNCELKDDCPWMTFS
jgi:hypothetical protein